MSHSHSNLAPSRHVIRTGARFAALLLCLTVSGWTPSLTTITVTTTSNSGPGSLREAILKANAQPGPDDIVFDIQTEEDPQGWWVIKLESPLPFLTDDGIKILGSTQSGWGATEQGTGGTVGVERFRLDRFPSPVIVIDANRFDGLTIAPNVSDILVEGISIINADNGVVALGVDVPGRRAGQRREVHRVFVGILPNGLAPGARMNTGHGIVVRTSKPDLPAVELDIAQCFVAYNGSSGITGGHPSSTVRVTRSEIAHNGWRTDFHDGIDLNGRNGRIVQNLIHDNRNESGTREPGSGNGIEVGSENVDAHYNVIESNSIVANFARGVSIVGGSSANIVRLNEIRGNGSGIVLEGEQTRANHLSRNHVFRNAGLGIDLQWEVDEYGVGAESGPGVTLNSISSGSGGPNLATAYPIIDGAVVADDTLHITGFSEAAALVEVFESDRDDSGFGEGRRWLFTLTEGSGADGDTGISKYGPVNASGTRIATDSLAANRFSFEVPLTIDVLGKRTVERAQYITSTSSVLDTGFSTDPSATGFNTSEFGPNVEILFLPSRVATLTPADGAPDLTAPVVFSWEPSDYSDAYVLEISSDPPTRSEDFASIILRDTLAGTALRTTRLRPGTRYYWHVRGINPNGAGSWSHVRSFSTSNPFSVPGKVALEFPTDGLLDVESALLLQWREEPLADEYEIQIARDTSFTATVMVEHATTTDVAHRITHLIPGSIHYWRVRARNRVGDGPWSQVWRFTTASVSGLGAVSLAFPDSGATSMYLQPLFRWSPLSDAQSYQIEIATDSLFTGEFVDATITPGTFHRSARLQRATRYYWRVTPLNNDGAGLWSSVWSFETTKSPPPIAQTIQLVSPDSGDVNVGLNPLAEFSWIRSECASTYDIEIARSSAFNSGSMVDAESTLRLSFTSDRLEPGQTYFWRVLGRDPACVDSSRTWVFSTGDCIGPDRVELVRPLEAEEVSVGATFVWNEQPDARYEITVSEDSTFGDGSLVQRKVTSTTETSGFRLNPATRYFWRVRASTDCDTGEWSEIRRFETRDEPPPPLPPMLIAPANGERNVSTIPTLIVHSEESVSGFRVQVSTVDTFVETVLDTAVTVPQLHLQTPLRNDTTYYWRAQARNAVGYSTWSTTSQFRTIRFKARFNEAVRQNRLAQNRPNPFNPSTTIEFELERTSHVSLVVFDIRGREVARLLDASVEEGVHSVVWDGTHAGGSHVPSGVYLYRLVAGDFTETKRMLLVK